MNVIDYSDPLWIEFYATFVGGRHSLVLMSAQMPQFQPIRSFGCRKGFALSHHVCGLNGFNCIDCVTKEYRLWRARIAEHDGLEKWFKKAVGIEHKKASTSIFGADDNQTDLESK
jgi:hypothetical protein